MKYGLNDTTIASIHGVIARYGQVDKAILYGSRAKGNYRAGSDRGRGDVHNYVN